MSFPVVNVSWFVFNVFVILHFLQCLFELVNLQELVNFESLWELLRFEFSCQRNQTEDGEYYFSNEVNWLFSKILDSKFCTQNSLSDTEFFNLHFPVFFTFLLTLTLTHEHDDILFFFIDSLSNSFFVGWAWIFGKDWFWLTIQIL